MIRRNGARVLVAGLAVGALALLTGCASGAVVGGAAGPSLQGGVASIPHRSVAPEPQARLAKGVLPPTNRWFTGLVFGSTPQPVFPLPLTFGLTGTGFAFGVPPVTTTADNIIAPYTAAVTITDGSTSSEVTKYDDASVTIAQKKGATTIGSVTIAEGSPVVTYTAAHSESVQLSAPFARVSGGYSASVGGSDYGLVTKGGVSGSTVKLAAGQTAEWVAVPHGSTFAKLASHVSALKSVSLGYSGGGSTVSTALTYHSSGDSLVAALPSQAASLTSARCDLGSYPSAYGTLSLCAGPKVAWTSPKLSASDSLDAGKLTDADKKVLTAQLEKDVTSTPAQPSDSYYGGKWLYRLANLLTIAHDVGDTSASASIQKRLDDALVKWTQPGGCKTRSTDCFVYDPKVHGVVGLTASFGSDQFNDHHFHYGYFLYAASVAAKYSPSLVKSISPVIDLLAADIASPEATTDFPKLRVFDAYAGHSWASGYAPFADGNNQESSSEAVDAWNGLALWSAVTKDAPLGVEATWLLSSEAATAKADWTNFDENETVYSGYSHGVVGINWGDKRDYATWFSAAPSAKLGIQLIPMSPASTYLAGDPKRITQNLAEGAADGYDVPLGDYLLMYSALEGADQAKQALATARTLPDKFIDDGDSRTYLLALIMAR